ncbi:MAG: class I SAM-dependent methyltransferase [Pyrinomonadaceae bacterium]
MPISFRDPAGYLFSKNARIFRFVKSSASEDLRAFLASETARKFATSGQLVRTDFLDPSALELELADEFAKATLIEHEKIPFPSFAYEWPPEMLHAAGALTLDLAGDLLEEGWGLKDATPYNVLFRGPKPVFIDLLSFERREPGDPTWLPYAQFVRTFQLPLLVNKHFRLPLTELLTTHRDGLEPEQVYDLLSASQKLRPEFMSLVSIPTWLASKRSSTSDDIYRKRNLSNTEKARFILERLLKGLRRKLDRVAPEGTLASTWSDYMSKNRYTEEYFPEKEAFVQGALMEAKPRMVLDVGCNTGFFSGLAAKAGASVIAIDYDAVVAGKVWQWARAEGLDIQPLVVDLTRPTPSIGWRNEECPSFLERARGTFDAVLMLAVIHHMLVTERIPLSEILQLASEITTNLLIVEFVAPRDQMFRVLTRGRERLHEDLTVEVFERTAQQFFEIVRSQRLGESDRWIYFMRKRVA